MTNPLTPAGIEQSTFRFVAQHLNHCATNLIGTKIIVLRELMPCIVVVVVVDTICKEPTVLFVDVRVLPWRWN